MKKNVFGRQLKRDINERKALFKNLMTQLVMHDRIETTQEKAKSIQASVEKLVTKTKNKGQGVKRELLPFLGESAVNKMIADIAPRFTERNGGYTRIVKLGRRFGDGASVVIMEWVEGSRSRLNQDQKSEKKVKNEKLESASSTKTDKKQVKATLKNKKSVEKSTKTNNKKEVKKKEGKKK